MKAGCVLGLHLLLNLAYFFYSVTIFIFIFTTEGTTRFLILSFSPFIWWSREQDSVWYLTVTHLAVVDEGSIRFYPVEIHSLVAAYSTLVIRLQCNIQEKKWSKIYVI